MITLPQLETAARHAQTNLQAAIDLCVHVRATRNREEATQALHLALARTQQAQELLSPQDTAKKGGKFKFSFTAKTHPGIFTAISIAQGSRRASYEVTLRSFGANSQYPATRANIDTIERELASFTPEALESFVAYAKRGSTMAAAFLNEWR